MSTFSTDGFALSEACVRAEMRFVRGFAFAFRAARDETVRDGHETVRGADVRGYACSCTGTHGCHAPHALQVASVTHGCM